MQTRASKRVESFRASQRIESLLSPRLDPKLWGNLPAEVLLKIYKALPVGDFYKLRAVCKEWNHVACARRCFSDPVPKPYFLLICHGQDDSPTGTLAYNLSSGRWIWRLHSPGTNSWVGIGDLYEPFAVEGIYFQVTSFGSDGYDFRLGVPQNLLFDVHTDTDFSTFRMAFGWRRIPEPPRTEAGSILGMMVDTSKRPYTYKLIMGSCNVGTQILDSQTNVWESKPSRMVRCRPPCRSSSPKSCLQFDGHMYIWSDSDEIQVYSLEEDKWSALSSPPRHASDEEFRGLGSWESELYAVTKNEQATLSVWKLIDRPKQEWSEFARIPSRLFSYLLQRDAMLFIETTHCNGYLLMHVRTASNVASKRWGEQKLGRRYVLFNISNKRWEKVTFPNGKMWR